MLTMNILTARSVVRTFTLSFVDAIRLDIPAPHLAMIPFNNRKQKHTWNSEHDGSQGQDTRRLPRVLIGHHVVCPGLYECRRSQE